MWFRLLVALVDAAVAVVMLYLALGYLYAIFVDATRYSAWFSLPGFLLLGAAYVHAARLDLKGSA